MSKYAPAHAELLEPDGGALMSKFDMLHVPYKSMPSATSDVVGRQVSMMFVHLAAGLATVKGG